MFKSVKQIKLEEAEKALETLKSKEHDMYQEYYTLKNQLLNLETKHNKMEWQAENGMEDFYGKRIPFWKRLFNAKERNEYRKYQNKLTEYKTSFSTISALEKQIEDVKKQIEEEVEKSAIRQKIIEAEKNYFKIKNATSLDKLGVTPTQAKELLQKYHLPVVIEPKDQIVMKQPNTVKKANIRITPVDQEITRDC